MPIDWSSVNWSLVALYSVAAFVAALIGHLLAFRSRFFGALLTGILFGAAFIFWNYYPHGIVLPVLKPA